MMKFLLLCFLVIGVGVTIASSSEVAQIIGTDPHGIIKITQVIGTDPHVISV